MEKPTVLLVDDHELMVEGLRRLLTPGYDIVATARNGREAVEMFTRLRPQVVLLDVSLPLLNGIECARQIKEMSATTSVIFVTMQMDRHYLEQAFRAGASGYVLKQSAVSDLILAIRAALQGQRYVSPPISSEFCPTKMTGSPGSEPLFGGDLTPRQREVLQLIAEGKAMKEIAALLHVSVRTAEFHKNCISQELGLHSTAELTRYAVEQGIVGSLRESRPISNHSF